jgi:hypothetical protein
MSRNQFRRPIALLAFFLLSPIADAKMTTPDKALKAEAIENFRALSGKQILAMKPVEQAKYLFTLQKLIILEEKLGPANPASGKKAASAAQELLQLVIQPSHAAQPRWIGTSCGVGGWLGTWQLSANGHPTCRTNLEEADLSSPLAREAAPDQADIIDVMGRFSVKKLTTMNGSTRMMYCNPEVYGTDGSKPLLVPVIPSMSINCHKAFRKQLGLTQDPGVTPTAEDFNRIDQAKLQTLASGLSKAYGSGDAIKDSAGLEALKSRLQERIAALDAEARAYKLKNTPNAFTSYQQGKAALNEALEALNKISLGDNATACVPSPGHPCPPAPPPGGPVPAPPAKPPMSDEEKSVRFLLGDLDLNGNPTGAGVYCVYEGLTDKTPPPSPKFLALLALSAQSNFGPFPATPEGQAALRRRTIEMLQTYGYCGADQYPYPKRFGSNAENEQREALIIHNWTSSRDGRTLSMFGNSPRGVSPADYIRANYSPDEPGSQAGINSFIDTFGIGKTYPYIGSYTNLFRHKPEQWDQQTLAQRQKAWAETAGDTTEGTDQAGVHHSTAWNRCRADVRKRLSGEGGDQTFNLQASKGGSRYTDERDYRDPNDPEKWSVAMPPRESISRSLKADNEIRNASRALCERLARSCRLGSTSFCDGGSGVNNRPSAAEEVIRQNLSR